MDFSNFKFRCSSLGRLFSQPRDMVLRKSNALSPTAKTHLYEIFLNAMYDVDYDSDDMRTLKGTEVEFAGVKMYAQLIGKQLHEYPKIRVENEYITGEIDMKHISCIEGVTQEVILDVKSCWDLRTFTKNRIENISSDYLWQLQGYSYLHKVKHMRLAHCLINTPQWLIDIAINRLNYETAPCNLEEETEKIIRMHRFDYIPFNQKIIVRPVERDLQMINRIPGKVMQCRSFLQKLYEETVKGNLLNEIN